MPVLHKLNWRLFLPNSRFPVEILFWGVDLRKKDQKDQKKSNTSCGSCYILDLLNSNSQKRISLAGQGRSFSWAFEWTAQPPRPIGTGGELNGFMLPNKLWNSQAYIKKSIVTRKNICLSWICSERLSESCWLMSFMTPNLITLFPSKWGVFSKDVTHPHLRAVFTGKHVQANRQCQHATCNKK